MGVPFIDLRRFEDGFLERWAEICRDITENTRFVGGPDVEQLERNLVQRTGAAAAVACANGTDALQLALRAVGVGPGDVVAIPDATFWATFEAVINCGGRPVTVDIDPDDLQLDLDLLRQALDHYQPKAVILVHLYGWGSGKLAEIRSLCREREIPLVEDGAQSFGVTYGGESIYRDALISTISFYPAKVLGACGDAGAVLCSDAEMADLVRRLGNHGRSDHYQHAWVGWNSRMSGFDAAFLNLSLEHFDRRLESRQQLAARYRQRLPELGVRVPALPAGYEENGYLNVTLQDPQRRDAVEAVLRDAGIGTGRVYPGSMSTQPGAEGHLHGAIGGERAEELSRSVLNLPLFAYMGEAEQDEVLTVLARAMEKAAAG
ncbi:MAG: aminotransferase class I/II-fold pyridoxal phosphate-dependent enzyme [Acidobacteriota bacterium]|nr:aminotransferase class I/II-fold pyridoxal phosphate-dependent enzyme [Acidobacteriota bacterium]